MKAFKLFFKIMWAQKKSILIYMSIFILLLVIFAQVAIQGKEGAQEMRYAQPRVAVVDEDDTALSRALTQYLTDHNVKVDVKADAESIKDALYADRLDYALVIPAGTEASMGKTKGKVNVTTYVGLTEMLVRSVDTQIETFLGVWDAFRLASGGSVPAEKAEAVGQEVNRILSTHVEGKVQIGDSGSLLYGFRVLLGFINYIMISLGFTVVGTALTVVEARRVKQRDLISCYPEGQRTRHLFMAFFLGMLILWSISLAAGITAIGWSILELGAAWQMVGSELIHLVAMSAVVLLISQLIPTQKAMSFFGTVLGLLVGFSCGIFVDKKFLWDPVVKGSVIFPTHWAMENHLAISTGTATTGELLGNCGLLLLMAAVFFCLTVMVRRSRGRAVMA